MTMNLPLIIFSISLSLSASSQEVPVREEPRHKPVLQNQYIRLLDVWLPPGDTSLYHIHATPSLFVVLSNALTSSQIKGRPWANELAAVGKAWYRSFVNDTLVHRVANIDTVCFHVNDIEILSAFDTSAVKTPLPFPLLFENERAVAYQLRRSSLNKKVLSDRGPIVAALISGTVKFHDTKAKRVTAMKAGNYLYISPGSSFYFAASGKDTIDMVVFEIK
jgi:hypothetical protein